MWGNLFTTKARCGECGDIVTATSDTKWTECTCGATAVMGKSFSRVRGKNYTDMTKHDFSEVPEHRGWDDEPRNKKENDA